MIHHHRLHSSWHDWALDSWQLWPVPLLITPAAIRGSDRWQYKDDDRLQFLQFQIEIQLLHYFYKLYVYYNCFQQSPGFRRQTKLGPNTALARWPLITATNWDLGPWSPKYSSHCCDKENDEDGHLSPTLWIGYICILVPLLDLADLLWGIVRDERPQAPVYHPPQWPTCSDQIYTQGFM